MFIAGYSAPFTGALEMFGLSEHRLSCCCWLQEKKKTVSFPDRVRMIMMIVMIIAMIIMILMMVMKTCMSEV